MTSSILDAAGRPVREGDTVGGTTGGLHPTTITGPVVQLGTVKARVRVTNRPTFTRERPGNGDDVWITRDRLFLVHPATERRFVGFRTPDGRTWTPANVKRVLWECPLTPKRYASTDLRRMYDAHLQPVWEDVPAAPATAPAAESPAEIRAAAFAEGAARITALPQDWELDPGRGESIALLQRLAAEAHQPDKYPLALPWALLMDHDDLRELLVDLFHTLSALCPVPGEQPKTPLQILGCVEKIAAGYRVIAEAQHAHNTAPGPDHVCNAVTARGHMDEPLGYLICGICGAPKDGVQQGRDTAAPDRDHA